LKPPTKCQSPNEYSFGSLYDTGFFYNNTLDMRQAGFAILEFVSQPGVFDARQMQDSRVQVRVNLPPLGLQSFWKLGSADPARTAR
jgi:hypothetical protein